MTGPKTEEDITPLVDRFLGELIANPKITQGDALVRAGSTAANPSAAAAALLKQPKVRAALRVRRDDLREALQIDALSVARKVATLVEADIPDIFDATGNLLPMNQWPAGCRSAVSQIEFDNPVWLDGEEMPRPRVKKVKFVDKLAALTILNKMLGLEQPKKVDITSNGQTTGIAQVLVIGDKRVTFGG